MPTHPIPILLVTGFLGAGKTTFINWLLQTYPEHKVSVVLNEFGAIKLESQFIKQKSNDVVELSNGCMCCVAKSDIPRVLKLIVEQSPQTQTIVIEASGLSDPDPILEALHNPEIEQIVRIDTILCIIDTVNFEKSWGTHSILSAQVGDADILLLSKTKEAGDETVSRVEHMLEMILPQARVVRMDAALPAAVFLDTGLSAHRLVKQSESSHMHAHEAYQTCWFQEEQPLDPNLLVQTLRAFPNQIIRGKGIIYSQENGKESKTLLQLVGSRFDFLPSEWAEGEERKTVLLFIGKTIEEEKLIAQLKFCIKKQI